MTKKLKITQEFIEKMVSKGTKIELFLPWNEIRIELSKAIGYKTKILDSIFLDDLMSTND